MLFLGITNTTTGVIWAFWDDHSLPLLGNEDSKDVYSRYSKGLLYMLINFWLVQYIKKNLSLVFKNLLWEIKKCLNTFGEKDGKHHL